MPTLTLFDGNAIWIVIGLSIAITLLISAARALKGQARRNRVLSARVATLADARDGELVIVQGKVRGEPTAPMVTTLITGKSALWMRTTVRGEVARPGLLRFTTLLRDVQGRSFTVEAPGGQFDVVTENARIAFAPERIARSYTPEEQAIDARLLPLFRNHPAELKDALIDDKARVDLRTFEEAIVPGDDISIVGIARPSGPHGFHLDPTQDGLYVVLGDVKALAQSGALWSDRPDV